MIIGRLFYMVNLGARRALRRSPVPQRRDLTTRNSGVVPIAPYLLLTGALDAGKFNVGKSTILEGPATARAVFRMGRCFGAECPDFLLDGRQVTYNTNTSSVSNNRT